MYSFRGLSSEEAEKFYDRFGARQDEQCYYEDAALAELIRHAEFESATAIAELGCGTGRFAKQILHPDHATYWGCDISAAMIELSRERLAKFGERITIWKSSGGTALPLQDDTVDRFISNYVLDILSVEETMAVLLEAKRVLKPDGLLCLTSITHGKGFFSKAWTAFWNLRFALNPKWVGGCRPIELLDFLTDWNVRYVSVVTARGISSEVAVAQKC